MSNEHAALLAWQLRVASAGAYATQEELRELAEAERLVIAQYDDGSNDD